MNMNCYFFYFNLAWSDQQSHGTAIWAGHPQPEPLGQDRSCKINEHKLLFFYFHLAWSDWQSHSTAIWAGHPQPEPLGHLALAHMAVPCDCQSLHTKRK